MSSRTTGKVGLWSGRGSVGRNPGQVLHLTKKAPSGVLSQGEGPQVRRSLDHSWKPGADPGR